MLLRASNKQNTETKSLILSSGGTWDLPHLDIKQKVAWCTSLANAYRSILIYRSNTERYLQETKCLYTHVVSCSTAIADLNTCKLCSHAPYDVW